MKWKYLGLDRVFAEMRGDLKGKRRIDGLRLTFFAIDRLCFTLQCGSNNLPTSCISKLSSLIIMSSGKLIVKCTPLFTEVYMLKTSCKFIPLTLKREIGAILGSRDEAAELLSQRL